MDADLDVLIDAVRPTLAPHRQVDPDQLDAANGAIAPAVDRLLDGFTALRSTPQRRALPLETSSSVLPPAAGRDIHHFPTCRRWARPLA